MCHCYNTLYKQINIVNNNNNNNKTIKAEQSKRRRGEREGKETYHGHEKGRAVSELSRVQCPLLYTMPRGSPEVATLSNTIDYELKSTDFWNGPFPHGLTQLNRYFGIHHDF